MCRGCEIDPYTRLCVGVHLLDGINVYDVLPVDAKETCRVNHHLQVLKRILDGILTSFSRHHKGDLVRCIEISNVLLMHQSQALSHTDQESLIRSLFGKQLVHNLFISAAFLFVFIVPG